MVKAPSPFVEANAQSYEEPEDCHESCELWLHISAFMLPSVNTVGAVTESARVCCRVGKQVSWVYKK